MLFIFGAAVGAGIAYAGAAQALSGPTPAWGATTHPWWAVLAECLTGPLFAIADVSAIATSASIWGDYPFPADTTIGFVAIGLGVLFLGWSLACRREIRTENSRLSQPAGHLALAVVGVTSVVLAILLWRGGRISWEGRHQQYGAFLLFPMIAEALARAWRTRVFPARVLTAIMATVLIAAPVGYGVIALARHAARSLGMRAAYTSSGLLLYWTADGAGAVAFEREMAGLSWLRQAVIATPVPTIALALPDHRFLLVLDSDRFEEERYRVNPPVEVAVLAPPWLAPEALAIIRAHFENVGRWEQINLASVPKAQLWRGR